MKSDTRPFDQRFQLLIDSGQATTQSVSAAKSALHMVERHYGVQLTEALGGSLANHLAITMKRLLDGAALMQAPEAVWQEIQEFPEEVALASRMVALLEAELNLSIPRDEVGFIALHLCRIRMDL